MFKTNIVRISPWMHITIFTIFLCAYALFWYVANVLYFISNTSYFVIQTLLILPYTGFVLWWLIQNGEGIRDKGGIMISPWVLVLLLIPYVNIAIFFIYLAFFCYAFAQYTDKRFYFSFPIWLVAFPVALFYMQRMINLRQ